ncbi:TadE/TadG family type IV pilus assembly protein [Novosphingobium rosa]|uniref:TadE/TadG family type IV pilus assembly protein n=1 Tax=Novosphingobium rosa TaxID=76978 RepID=UPI00082BBC50|nr:pilus assembly protein TadG-related protein [Novosphingobium rosa]
MTQPTRPSPLHLLIDGLRRLARGLRADRRGNVMSIMAFAAIPLIFAIGFGLDYSRAQKLQTKMNAAADAAVLAAVVPQLLNQSDAMAQTAAQNMFDQQVAGLPGMTTVVRTVTITSTVSATLGRLRTAKLVYTAKSTNFFGGVLGAATLPIGGTATASASQPPSINFYIALDTSPSMLLPTTSTGISNLIGGAIWQGEMAYYGRTDGCDFACHSNNMHQWNAGTYVIDTSSRAIYLNNSSSSGTNPFFRVDCSGNVFNSSGTKLGTSGTIVGSATYCGGYSPLPNPVVLSYVPTGQVLPTTVSVNFPDTWWLAQNYSKVNPGQSDINLRTDDEGTAAAGVIQYAYNIQQQFATATVPPVYKMQFFTFNVGNPAALSTSPFGTMTNVSTLQSATFPDLGAQAPLMAANGSWTNILTVTGNADTNFTYMFNWMQSTMTASGTGTPASPQNVLLIVTDGAQNNNTGDGMGQLNANNIAQCAAIKATGTRIAILYTQYLPATINYTKHPTFNSFAANNVPYIQQQLQACASQNTDGSYLFQTVSTDGNVSTALNSLFAMVVQSAKLVR